MKKFGYVLAALAAIIVAAPSIASAETVVIKRGGYHHGDRGYGARAEFRGHQDRGYHRGWRGHGDRVVVRTMRGEVMTKQLARRSARRIELKSLNPAHQDYCFDLIEIAWMHRIVWASQ